MDSWRGFASQLVLLSGTATGWNPSWCAATLSVTKWHHVGHVGNWWNWWNWWNCSQFFAMAAGGFVYSLYLIVALVLLILPLRAARPFQAISSNALALCHLYPVVLDHYLKFLPLHLCSSSFAGLKTLCNVRRWRCALCPFRIFRGYEIWPHGSCSDVCILFDAAAHEKPPYKTCLACATLFASCPRLCCKHM